LASNFSLVEIVPKNLWNSSLVVVAGDAELEGVGVLDVGIEPTPEDDAG
jgi:hypothetical protein